MTIRPFRCRRCLVFLSTYRPSGLCPACEENQ